jgi:cytidylate kinase
MKDHTREEPKILAAAERQMQAWAMTAEIEGRAIRAEGPHRVAERMGRYLSISREAGAGGGEIAQLVGRRLGWEVLDRNLIDRIAERFNCSRGMLELVDETESSWVYNVLGTWMDRKIVTHDKYVACLGRVVLAAVRHGNVVLVGRGAQFMLPREKGLAVRLIASRKYRIEQMIGREGLSQADAGRRIDQLDRGRREFAQRYFHQDIDDPHLYGLVLNVEQLGPAVVVQQIVAALSH